MKIKSKKQSAPTSSWLVWLKVGNVIFFLLLLVAWLSAFRDVLGGDGDNSAGNLRATVKWTQNDIERKRQLAVKSSGYNPKEERIFDHGELNNYFDCHKLFEKPRVGITDDEWRYFRQLFNEYIAKEYEGKKPETYKLKESSTHVNPVSQNITPDKGRGLIASRDIRQGELIFTGTNNTIIFTTGESWRNFLLHLYYSPPPLDGGYEDGFACDILAWSWNQQWPPPDGEYKIMVDIDASSLLNSPSEGEEHNIQCGEQLEDDEEDTVCGVDYFATRDIKKGEEILCDYSDFSHPTWDSFGL